MTAPYQPATFASPAINPAVGGAGFPVPYVSNSQFAFAPTAMDIANLVPGGTLADQARSLGNVLARASAWADRYCFGAVPAAKGASLVATTTVQTAMIRRHLGAPIRLVCDYKPILSVIGVDLGPSPTSLASIGQAGAASLWFGRRTIYLPESVLTPMGRNPIAATTYAAWSYVSGYPHTALAASVEAGATTITVAATDGAGGVLGIFPGTQLTITDGAATETVTVTELTGTVLTVTPLAHPHTVATAPDFVPVTAMPADVIQAVIFLAMALIKSRGDNSMVLASLTEPNEVKSSAGDEFTDVGYAKELLHPYRIRIKSGA
jgi:hypothetical protein